MPDIYTEVGLHIRARRQKLGLTLEELAERAGLSASYIGQVERDVKKASLKSLGILASALGVRVSSLFNPDGALGRLPWGTRIDNILDLYSPGEQRVLISTLRHLAKELKTFRRR